MIDTVTITDLSKVAKENNLPATNADALQAAFMPFFEQASEWREKAFSIKVTNIGQTAEMGRARQARLALKDIRVQTEKTRVAMKEDSLRTGKAIDGMSNVIKFLIEPIETYLLDQEEYGKRMQEKAQAEARQVRQMESGTLHQYFPANIDLGTITDEEFAYYLNLAKIQAKAIQDEHDRVERERIERERKEAAEREAMRAENERLKAEAQERELAMQAERAERERVQREMEAKIAAERAEVERLRMEAEAKERAERERVQRETEAPDKDKLLRYAEYISSIEVPTIQSEALNQRLAEARSFISRAVKILSE